MTKELPLLPSKTKRKDYSLMKLLSLSFGVSAGLMALIYFCIGVPFLGNSVLVLDLNGQYVYFFESLHNLIYEGNASMLYTWCRDLGGEYMGIFAYYLASPLSWLVALMPSSLITESLYLMILSKVGLAGASMAYYLQKTFPDKKLNVVLFSTLYALSAWSVMYGNNVMWLDTLILFPLVIRGAELLFSGRGYRLFTVSLTLTMLSHYYMAFMVCIFLVLYFFYYHFSRNKEETYNPKNRRFHFLKSGLSFTFFSLLSAGMAAVILFTALYSLSFGKNTFTDPTYEFTFKLNFMDILFKLMPGATDTVRREGLPFLYCGTVTLFMLPIFFLSKKIRTKEKIGSFLLLLSMVFCFSVSVIDILWHGGQEPNWLNYRYSFIFSFLLLVLAYRGFGELPTVPNYYWAPVTLVLGVVLVLLQALGYGKGYEYTEENFPLSYNYDLFFYFLGAVIIAFVFFALLFYKRNLLKKVGTLVLTSVILGETFLVGLLHEITLAYDVGYSSRASYSTYMKRVEPAVDYIHSMDHTFYRMEKTFHRQPADTIGLNMKGVSSTTSTLNRHTLKLLQELGYAGGSYWSEYADGNPVTDMLLDIKYVLDDEKSKDLFYQRIYTDEKGQVYGYLNPYSLGLGYMVHSSLSELDFESYASQVELLNALTVKMTGKEDLSCFEPLIYEEKGTVNVSLTYVSSPSHNVYTKDDKEQPAYIEYKLFLEKDQPVYMCIPSTYPRECKLFLDNKEIGKALGNDSDCILFLGNLKTGNYTVKLEFQKDKTYFRRDVPYFFGFNESKLKECHELLSANAFQMTDYMKDNHFKGKVTVSGENTLFFTSIPYDLGWKITVDGKEVSPLSFEKELLDKETGEVLGTEKEGLGGALIALSLEEGTHEIEFHYLPDAFVYGGIVSLSSLFLFLAIVGTDSLISYLKMKKAKKIANTAKE